VERQIVPNWMDRQPTTGLTLSRLHFPVTTLGPGRRAGIWVQGCSIRCPGCISLDTWDEGPDSRTVPVAGVVDWLLSLVQQGLEGITISGGEPFDQAIGLKHLMVAIGTEVELRDVDVLVYSGYSQSRLKRGHSDILAMVDAVISGPFVQSRPTDLPWQGSANQQLVLLTDRAADRFGTSARTKPSLQISVDGGHLWITGVPRRGDLEQFEATLAARGVTLGEVSWRA